MSTHPTKIKINYYLFLLERSIKRTWLFTHVYTSPKSPHKSNRKRHTHNIGWNRRLFLTPLVLALIAGVFLMHSTPIQAAWFNDNYAYRQKFSFTHNAAITNERAITFSLDTAELITAGLMQSDCDDTRFTDINGKVLLYQLTGTCNNSATTYEVVFPSIINGNNPAYVYYGNPSAASASQNVTRFTALTPSGGDPGITDRTVEEKGPAVQLYLPFDNGYGTTASDQTQHRNNGSISGAAWKTADLCYRQHCLFFDGSDDVVTVTNADAIDFDKQLAGAFTIQAWIRVNSDGENDVGQILQKGTNTYMRVDSEGSDGYADLEVSLALATANATVNVTNGITLHRWHHVALTYTDDADDEVTVYIDGKQAGVSTDGQGTPAADSNNLLVGGTTTANFHGYIDEVKIYDQERTSSQIYTDTLASSDTSGVAAQLGQEPNTIVNDNLLSYWNLDQFTGENATDLGGNGKTLTNNNSIIVSIGKYYRASQFNGTTQYFSSAATIDRIKTISFWVYPGSTTNNFFHFNGSTYITASSGTITATGFTSPKIFINGRESNTLTASTWNHVVVTSTAAITASSFEAGRANGSYLSSGSRLDEIRLYSETLQHAEVQKLIAWAPGPIGYWDFNERAGTTAGDKSGNANNGTLTSGPVWANGKSTGGLSFDGTNDSVVITDNATLRAYHSFTLSSWVKADVFPGVSNTSNLINRGQNLGVENYYFSLTENDELLCGFYDDLDPHDHQTTTLSLQSNVWYYLTCTFDDQADLVKMYVNGIEVYSAAEINMVIPSTGDLVLGTSPSGASYFNGTLDDVKVYNYARSPKQILEDMNQNHPIVGTPVSGPVGHWSFDEGSGSTANDKSQNNHRLSVSSNTSWTNNGKLLRAWHGDGSQWLYLFDNDNFDFGSNTDFAVSGWIKSDDSTNPSTAEYIVSKESSSAGYAIWFTTGGELICGIDDDASSFPEDQVGDTASNTDLYDGLWHHTVCTRDSATSTLNLYIDGKLFDQKTSISATGALSNSDALTLGDRNAVNDSDDYRGSLDEFKIYRASLTAEDVKADYTNGKVLSFGSLSTADDGRTASQSAARSYCPPGNVDGNCAPGFNPSPIGEWYLDERTGTSTKETSGYSTTSTLTNSPKWQSGKLGQSLFFSRAQSQYVEMGDVDRFDFSNTDDFTISGWIKTNSLATDSTVVAKKSGITTQIGFIVYINDTTGTIRLVVADGTDSFQIESPTGIALDTWYHFTAVWDQDSTANSDIYINGVPTNGTETGTIGNIDALTPSTSELRIGADAGTVDEAMNGNTDTIRIYNYARTPAQIAWDYNRGAPVGQWKFDECSGTKAYDSSINANHGTITPGASGNTAAGTCISGTSTDMWYDGATGKYNASLGFDSTDDYVTITNNSTLDLNTGLTNGFSMSVWFYANSDGEGDNGILFSKGADTYCKTTAQSGSTLSLACTLDLTTSPPIPSISGVNIGTWNHLVITWTNDSDDEMTMWLNGHNRTTSTDGDGSPNIENNGIIIGNDSGQTATFDGLIDNFQVFNYELSAAQIRTLYNENASVRFGPNTGQP